MHRLLVSHEELVSDAPVLPKEAQRHLKVLRVKAGEEVELFDGRGAWRVFRVRAARETAEVALQGVSDVCRAQPRTGELSLFACVTKGSRWDWTIEKATELGVTRIVPVISARTIVRIDPQERAAKRERWQRIAEDAARQSDAKWLPEIAAPVSFAESVALFRATTGFVGALTTPPPRPIGAALRDVADLRNASLYVGPEGDFTPEELAALLEVATPVSFGSTILRAETAAIYGLSALKSAVDSAAGGPEAR